MFYLQYRALQGCRSRSISHSYSKWVIVLLCELVRLTDKNFIELMSRTFFFIWKVASGLYQLVLTFCTHFLWDFVLQDLHSGDGDCKVCTMAHSFWGKCTRCQQAFHFGQKFTSWVLKTFEKTCFWFLNKEKKHLQQFFWGGNSNSDYIRASLSLNNIFFLNLVLQH